MGGKSIADSLSRSLDGSLAAKDEARMERNEHGLMLPETPPAARRAAGPEAAAFRPALCDIIKRDVLEAHRR
jgi:hypothetical protein